MSQGSRKKSVSATTLAIHHHLQCDLFLYNSYHGLSVRDHRSNRRPELSELTKATFSRGDKWESTLFSWLDAKGLLLTILGGSLEGQEIEECIDIDERDHFFVAGLSFIPPANAFESKFRGNGQTPIQFGVAKPDLVEIQKQEDGTISWRVIDAKSSAEVKTSHHVQIYFYHVCLANMLSSCYRPVGTAAVWIPPSIYGGTSVPSFDGLRSIATPLLSLPLDEFLFNKLPRVLSQQREEVKWHLNPLCRGCAYERNCTERALDEGEIGTMANISIQDAEVLKSILAMSEKQDAVSDIEDLYAMVGSKTRMANLKRSHPSVFKKVARVLKTQGKSSPVLEAALTNQVQILNKRIFTLPSEEDIAIVISLVLDPNTNDIAAYCISTFSSFDASISPGVLSGTRANFIRDLASILQYVLDLSDVHSTPPRTQCYVFSPVERSALQRILINAALTSDKLDEEVQDAIRTCIGAVCEGASLLATSFQPLVLSGALLGFLGSLGRQNGVTAVELRSCLRRLGLSNQKGTMVELRQRINDELARLHNLGKNKRDSDFEDSTGSNGNNTNHRPEIGAIPRVVVVKSAIEQLLALPVPGYWDLPKCHELLKTSSLVCPTEESIYSAFAADQSENLEKMLRDRNASIYESLLEARKRVSAGKVDILVNEAHVLTSEFMDICIQDHLRKLFFMQQFEVLAKLNALWQDRIEGCIEAPRLEYKFPMFTPDKVYTHHFKLISGYVDLSSDKERMYYSYILTEDVDSDSELPIEALFVDLAVFNLVFPLNKNTRGRWNQQPPIVQQRLFVADISDMNIKNNETFVVLRTFGAYSLHLKPGARYRLSPRLVDFNVTKVLSTLVELDLQTPAHPGYMLKPPFLQLFSDPKAFAKFSGEPESVVERYWTREGQIQRVFRELSGLGSQAATSLLPKASQRNALRRILKYRLSVIWGPPGTGKTYTISLSLLRLVQIKSSDVNARRQIIFLTAMTHAAIEACLSKLRALMQNYRSFPGMDLDWLDNISLERVLSGATHPAPSDIEKTYIFAGTVYQLYSYCRKTKIEADCIVIDEAGQLGLGPASLVLKSLQNTGRVIVAGDSEQLAPILTTQYPQIESHLFGSVLDCLMSDPGDEEPSKELTESEITSTLTNHDQATISTIIQLTENFRLNPDLGEFVSTIYKRSFKPQKSQSIKLAQQLEGLANIDIQDATRSRARDILVALSSAMRRRRQDILQEPKKTADKEQSVLSLDLRPISLCLIRLGVKSSFPDRMGYEIHVRAEATLAASLVHLLHEAAPEESVFVASPHRVQRQAVKDALATRVDDLSEALGALRLQGGESPPVDGKVTVDTIERLQGSEAAFVICLFSHTYPGNVSTTVDFLLERRRLNVAISRAKTLCILVTSQDVLRPSVRVFSNPRSAKGFAFLKAFEDRAWSADATVNLDELI